MLTPDERYMIQQIRDSLGTLGTTLSRALELNRRHAAALDKLLDLGPNPHIDPRVAREHDILTRQMKAAAEGPVCTCDFGWQPDCPRHAQRHDVHPAYPDEAWIEDHQRTSYHPEAPARGTRERAQYEGTWAPADHQRERPVQDGKDRLYNVNPDQPVRPDGSRYHWPVCPRDHGPETWCPSVPPDIIEAYDRFTAEHGEQPPQTGVGINTKSAPAGPGPCPKPHPHEGACWAPTPRDLFGRKGLDH